MTDAAEPTLETIALPVHDTFSETFPATSPKTFSHGPEDWVAAAFEPRSVAVIGASDNPEKIGGRPIKYMLQHGFKGRIYAINPQRAEIQGLKAWPGLAALPEVPDVAVICVPGEAAVEAVRGCAAMGVKLGVVIASGFGETGEEGRAAQNRMLSAARAHGMRLVGPNTQGIVNFSNGAIASFATLIGEVGVADGPVAIVSQSGAMSVVPYALLRAEGVGVRHAHATGNECDLTVADFAWAAAGDPSVKLILLYIESLPDPSALARAAARAAERGIPVLALKAGVSARGQAAASSHTGAIATEDKVLDAFFRQNGIVRVPDMRSLVRSARLWLNGGTGTEGGGNRVAAISNSGACCVMAADAAERHGLDMQPFGTATREALEAVLPGFASGANPVDLTAALLSNSGLFGQVLPVIAQGNAADAYFISLPMSGKGYDVPRFASDAAAFQASTGKPTVVASPLGATREVFEAQGVVSFEHDEDAMAALGEFVLGRRRMAEARRLAGAAVTEPQPLALPAASGFLSEHDSLGLIAALGIPVVGHALCRTPDEMMAAVAKIPAPWVVKACSAAIPHKTEYGLVRLGVQTAGDALAAFHFIRDACTKLDKPLDGVIVAPMLRSQRELILGARWDERFGAIVVVGDGGKYVEAMPDAATVVYPFDAQHLATQLQSLRMAPLWRGVRGEQALPLLKVAEAAVSLGRWVHAEAGRVMSADINPLMAGPGDTLVAVDALVELAPLRG